MRIFGDLWDAPVCDGKVAEPAPVGEPCISCREPIRPGDSGFMMAHYTTLDALDALDAPLDWRPQHKECSLLDVIGHEFGYCGCTEYLGLSEREAGRAVWAKVTGESLDR